MLQNGKRNNGNSSNPTKTDGVDSNTIRFTRSITTLDDGTHSGEITYCNLIEGEKNDRIKNLSLNNTSKSSDIKMGEENEAKAIMGDNR